MNGPLTEEQHEILNGAVSGNGASSDAIEAALRRLDFLERKVQAADCLVRSISRVVPPSTVCTRVRALTAYDEVTE
jgi:hypothetical protein